jgi:hypothetical protein|nr:MAG TPA: hypothetical protein [Caudoviricetes sp.]
MIFHITPYLTGDIGKGINDTIKELPEDSWICLRDIDTMFLLPEQPRWLETIVASNPPYDLIGASCNRLGSPYQLYNGEISEDRDISHHIAIAKMAHSEYGNTIEPVPKDKHLAGFFLLFRKTLWEEIPFEERSIQFDLIFSSKLHEEDKALGLLRGMYLFHTYRLDAIDPRKAISHLIHCQDMSKIIEY